MNILRTAALVVIFIKCITASADRMSQFRKAVDVGDMDKAVGLRWSSLKSYEERLKMFNYVVDTSDQEFIFEFAKQAKVEKDVLLVALHRKKSPNMIKEAFRVFGFDQDDLKWAASRLELMCSPDDLLNLLDKIKEREDQKQVIKDGVHNLFFYERT